MSNELGVGKARQVHVLAFYRTEMNLRPYFNTKISATAAFLMIKFIIAFVGFVM